MVAFSFLHYMLCIDFNTVLLLFAIGRFINACAGAIGIVAATIVVVAATPGHLFEALFAAHVLFIAVVP